MKPVFLAYVDSSGRPTFEDSENFVLASVITQESNWQYIDNGVKKIKIKHFPSLPDDDVEIHAKDMIKHQRVFTSLTPKECYAVFTDVFDFIADKDTNVTIIAVLIDKSKLYRDRDIETWAYRLLFERINKFIERRNNELLKAQFSREYGILIMDSEGTTKDNNLRRKLFLMLRQGTLYSQLGCLIEDPLFTDSKWRNLSQLVDCVAYCIRKKYRTNTPSDFTTLWEGYYTKIESKFDTVSGNYLGYGLKIFP